MSKSTHEDRVKFVMEPRAGVGQLIDAHLRGEIPFSGPGSLCEKVSALGYKTTSLYEMVRAAEAPRTGGLSHDPR